MEAFSDTNAAAALYETHQARLKEYIAAFSATDNQAGALFAINGEVTGLDLFDSPATLKSMLPKLVQSYALDAIDAGDKASAPEMENAGKLIEDTVNAVAERFPAVGEGEDLRLQGEQLSGGALVVNDRIVHLCVFRLRERGNKGAGGWGTRLVAASQRRRGRARE